MTGWFLSPCTHSCVCFVHALCTSGISALMQPSWHISTFTRHPGEWSVARWQTALPVFHLGRRGRRWRRSRVSPWPSSLWFHRAFPHLTLPSVPSFLLGEATGSLCARPCIRATVGLSYPFTHLAVPECNDTQPALPDKQPQPCLQPSWPYCGACRYEFYSVLFSRLSQQWKAVVINA